MFKSQILLLTFIFFSMMNITAMAIEPAGGAQGRACKC